MKTNFLGPNEARCKPSLYCPMKETCLRYLSILQKEGYQWIMDASVRRKTWRECKKYVPIVEET